MLYEGEVRDFKAGVMIGTWEAYAFTRMRKICLSADESSFCGDSDNAMDVDQTWKAFGPEKCPEGSKCAGFSAKGNYGIKTDANGDSKLVLDGELTWAEGARNMDKGFGVMFAISTSTGRSEWSANSWDPNDDKWRFYSSYNRCKISKMRACSKKLHTFRFDKTWRSNMLGEEENYVKFSQERDFKHARKDRQLKIGETR